MMSAWRDQTQTRINDCLEKLWKEWSQQAPELQTLRADAENQRKVDDKFYKMDEESIVTIREELSEDFFALAEVHLKEVWGLVEVLDDGQLDAQLLSNTSVLWPYSHCPFGQPKFGLFL